MGWQVAGSSAKHAQDHMQAQDAHGQVKRGEQEPTNHTSNMHIPGLANTQGERKAQQGSKFLVQSIWQTATTSASAEKEEYLLTST